MRWSSSPKKLGLLLFGSLLLGACVDGGSGLAPAQSGLSQETTPIEASDDYAGSESCRDCHELFYERWAPSHHGLAMQRYADDFAQANLAPQSSEIVVGRSRFRAQIAPGQGWVLESQGEESVRHPIEYVLGGKNVYYFLTPLEKGRLQTLPVAFDVRQRRWFDTAASGVRHFPGVNGDSDSPVPWKNWRFTFNTACHSCHVSQLSINYDPRSDRYRTQWREAGIACETCHGPAQRHVRIARDTPPGQPLQNLAIVQVRTLAPAQRNDLCAGCHAKIVPLGRSFSPGDRFFDHFDLATLEDPDFYPDGRDLGENYTYTSWLMSPCTKSGELDCIHCHTSSGRYRFASGESNGACLPCHAEKVSDISSHSHHAKDGEADKCISCHMPMTDFARMTRTDHSMRPPSPSATLAFDSPNACNGCHRDRSPEWARRQARKWWPADYDEPMLRLGDLVAAARRQDFDRLPEILGYIRDTDHQAVFAASLIRLLAGIRDSRIPPVLIGALEDPSPLVRSAAAEMLAAEIPTAATIRALLEATDDEFRVVRIRAVAGLLDVPAQRLSNEAADRLQRATQEYLACINARPDQWASHYNLGNFHLSRGDLREAIAAFQEASRMEPEAIMPLVNASLAYARLGELDASEDLLRRALELVPENAAANFNLGLLEAERGRAGDAERHLRAALHTDPRMAEAAYNLGLLVSGEHPNEGLRLAEQAFEIDPSPKYGYSLAFLHRQTGHLDRAVRVLENVVERWPEDADSSLLLGDLYLRTHRVDRLAQLLERARSAGRLDRPVLARLEAMLRQARTSREPG